MLHAPRAALLAAFLLALPLVAPAHEKDTNPPEDRLVDKFTRFAGSKANAEALVNGLRNDQEVKLTSAQGTTTSFTPKTDKMGFGSVNISLTLAKATLAQQGITRPTPQQIQAALNGGTVTNSSGRQGTVTGILPQPASGTGTVISTVTATTPSSSTTSIIAPISRKYASNVTRDSSGANVRNASSAPSGPSARSAPSGTAAARLPKRAGSARA